MFRLIAPRFSPRSAGRVVVALLPAFLSVGGLNLSLSSPAQTINAISASRLHPNHTRITAGGLQEPVELTLYCSPPLCVDWSSAESDNTATIAWGDYDGDGDLDLAVGNNGQPNRLYRNDSGVLTVSSVWSSSESDLTYSVAWGDVDGDGDLDLAVGNYGAPNRLYRNENGSLTASAVWSSAESDYTTSIAWGDVDGDGDLDLAIGNADLDVGQPNRLYSNEGGILTTNSVWSSDEWGTTWTVAWGDADGDGDLDLAAGNTCEEVICQPIHIYENNGGALATSAAWSLPTNAASVAWGDVDSDGDLDLAAGNQLYRNDSGVLTMVWSATESGAFTSVSWGDYDSDGDLDLALGNYGPNRLYRNDNGALTPTAVWSSTVSEDTQNIAWGDVDGDGDLDLAVGNWGQPNRLYRNDGIVLMESPVWSSGQNDYTQSVAWGDVDDDGDLDLAAGNGCRGTWPYTCYPNRLYRNTGGILAIDPGWLPITQTAQGNTAWGDYDSDGDVDLVASARLYRNDSGLLTTDPVWSPADSNSGSVAWGDYDNDGDLDIALGLYGPPKLYRNDNGLLSTSPVWSSTSGYVTSLAWGDVEGDGDLDLAVGNYGGPNRLFRNNSGMLETSAIWSSTESDNTQNVAWGDVDGDGDLDLAAANRDQLNRLYRNDAGVLTSSAVWSSFESDWTNQVAWGDVDGDGDHDLATGNYFSLFFGQNRLYRNDGGMLTANAVWASFGFTSGSNSVAWGDVDGDGDLDLAAGNDDEEELYHNGRDARLLPGSVPTVHIIWPGAQADLFSSAHILSGTIPLIYSLADPQSDSVQYIRAWYSLDGGGQWLPAIATSATITANLTTTATYTYNWDTFASGFFGQSENVVFRLEAIPAISTTANAIPGPYLYGSYASSTFPFRVRGTQVRVLSDTVPISNAVVYRLPAGQTVGALPFADLTGNAYRTEGQGYLHGRGQVNLGDQLVAMLPISWTDSYTLYYTSAAPTFSGLNMFTVITPGVQTLTISSANQLALFNLDLSLEWDARPDSSYLTQLAFNLHKASDYLYDATNGQAALGRVRIFFDKEHWDTAHLRLYANNRLRPFAAIGGVVSEPLTEPVTSTVVYLPGQVHMAATWNRYGNPGVTLGEDWPRALAHELGHYLLFQDDNYLGLDANNRLIPIGTCTGTLMSDPYRDDYSEFKRDTDWLPGCAATLANNTTGRADWATIGTFYPLTAAVENLGPSVRPLAVTQIDYVYPTTPTSALADPRFYLTYDGASYQPDKRARAFLIKRDRLLDLGSPVVDQVLARGAAISDTVCVFEPTANRQGCKIIVSASDQQLPLTTTTNWQPDVIITPVTTQTIQVAVTLSPTLGPTLMATLYSTQGEISETLPLTLTQGVYSTTFQFGGDDGVLGAFIYVTDPTTTTRGIITEYALGGNPANARSGFANARSGFANARSGFAPVVSGDGQVIIYTPGITFTLGSFYAVQAATYLPNVPVWSSVVGKGYRVLASSDAPDMSGASISLSYVKGDVPLGGEPFLRVYAYDGLNQTWTALTSTVNITDSSVAAGINGPGLYAVMTAIEIQLYGPGWDSFAYPVLASQSITAALQSIAGYYGTVYWNNAADSADPWKMYDADVPPYVVDLYDLRFGEAYWISMTQSVVLRLNGSPTSPSPSEPLGPEPLANFQLPPATYYGAVLHSDDFVPAPGLMVRAFVNGVECGRGLTLLVDGQIVYSVNVSADGPSSPGCGMGERWVMFVVDGRRMATSVAWDNSRPRELILSVPRFLYLPLIRR